jgi:hypothetical protein
MPSAIRKKSFFFAFQFLLASSKRALRSEVSPFGRYPTKSSARRLENYVYEHTHNDLERVASNMVAASILRLFLLYSENLALHQRILDFHLFSGMA